MTSEAKNKKAGCLLDSGIMLVTMYVNYEYKEQYRAAAG